MGIGQTRESSQRERERENMKLTVVVREKERKGNTRVGNLGKQEGTCGGKGR